MEGGDQVYRSIRHFHDVTYHMPWQIGYDSFEPRVQYCIPGLLQLLLEYPFPDFGNKQTNVKELKFRTSSPTIKECTMTNESILVPMNTLYTFVGHAILCQGLGQSFAISPKFSSGTGR